MSAIFRKSYFESREIMTLLSLLTQNDDYHDSEYASSDFIKLIYNKGNDVNGGGQIQYTEYPDDISDLSR
jgi:hypothetical protein